MARVVTTGDAARSHHPAFRPPADYRRPWHPGGRWYEPGEWYCCHGCGSYFDPVGEQRCSVNYCGECAPPLGGE